MCKISSKKISVVIQGAIDKKNTPKCINSIKAFLPEAEIILSTWKGCDATSFSVDKILYNDDPGFSYDDPAYKRTFNLNRWIKSSVEGVKCASRKYVLKCRSDIEIISLGFLKYWDKYEYREEEYSISEHKILIPSTYTLEYLGEGKRKIETPFHVSDWYCFGLKTDILDFVSCPIIEDLRKFSRHFAGKLYHVPAEKRWWIDNWLRKMAPEQYIGLCYAQRKFGLINIEDPFTFINFDNEFAEKFLLSNFIVLDPMQYGIILNKYRDLSRKIYILDDYLWNGLYRNRIYTKKYYKFAHKFYSGLIDVAMVKQKVYKKMAFLKIILKKIYQSGKKIYLATKLELQNMIRRAPRLYIIFSTLYILLYGQFVNIKVRKYFANNKPILLCPYRGTGDSYIVGNYLKENGVEKNYNLIVQRDINKKILGYFGIYNVFVINKTDNIFLQKYSNICGNKNLHILHFADEFGGNNTGYNLAAFKNINFADYYDYVVFGGKKTIKYKKIISNCQIDYSACGLVKGKSVLLAPYSDSINGISMAEWKYLAKKLQEKGYSVATNCANDREKKIPGTINVCIPFDQVAEFVEWCGFFISIRSGLCDFVSPANCRKIILYPKYIKYKYGKYIDFFTLNVPERGLYAEEYEYESSNNMNVISKILKTF